MYDPIDEVREWKRKASLELQGKTTEEILALLAEVHKIFEAEGLSLPIAELAGKNKHTK